MSVLKFELKEDHLKLLKNLNWDLKIGTNVFKLNPEHIDEELLYDPLWEEVDLILNGKTVEYDPNVPVTEFTEYPEEQIRKWTELLNELPIAFDIIMQTHSFELGWYKSKFHVRNWRKDEMA